MGSHSVTFDDLPPDIRVEWHEVIHAWNRAATALGEDHPRTKALVERGVELDAKMRELGYNPRDEL